MGEIKTVNEWDNALDSNLKAESLSMADFEETGEVLEQSDNSFTRVVRQKKNSQLFKLKSIPKPVTENSAALLESLELAKNLIHPQINRVYQKFEDSKAIHFLVEYVPNHSLYLELILKECISNEDALNFLGQIHNVMDFLQSRNLFLKSLDPERILIREDRQIVFTESIFVQEISAYTPPEGWGSKEGNNWALGLLIFEITQGFSPFKKPVSIHSPQFELEFDPLTSCQLKDFILRSLKINPHERFTTKQETPFTCGERNPIPEKSYSKVNSSKQILKTKGSILKASPNAKNTKKRNMSKSKTIDRLEKYLNRRKFKNNKINIKGAGTAASIDLRSTKNTEEVIVRKEHNFKVQFDDSDLVSIVNDYEAKQNFAETKKSGMFGWINKWFR